MLAKVVNSDMCKLRSALFGDCSLKRPDFFLLLERVKSSLLSRGGRCRSFSIPTARKFAYPQAGPKSHLDNLPSNPSHALMQGYAGSSSPGGFGSNFRLGQLQLRII